MGPASSRPGFGRLEAGPTKEAPGSDSQRQRGDHTSPKRWRLGLVYPIPAPYFASGVTVASNCCRSARSTGLTRW